MLNSSRLIAGVGAEGDQGRPRPFHQWIRAAEVDIALGGIGYQPVERRRTERIVRNPGLAAAAVDEVEADAPARCERLSSPRNATSRESRDR